MVRVIGERGRQREDRRRRGVIWAAGAGVPEAESRRQTPRRLCFAFDNIKASYYWPLHSQLDGTCFHGITASNSVASNSIRHLLFFEGGGGAKHNDADSQSSTTACVSTPTAASSEHTDISGVTTSHNHRCNIIIINRSARCRSYRFCLLIYNRASAFFIQQRSNH